ncbi:hypothetical protein [Tsuneonella suprasediminis]|uniref:hypothetical protein n=1 Tax=Tsuneonella suprasediminis TaxID=2306996 RepID=UPI002F9389D5
MKQSICAVFLAFAGIVAAPAQAQSADEMYGRFDVLWDNAVPPVDSCESRNRIDAVCGRSADKLVCTANAIYVALEESGLADRFPRQISGLNRLLSQKADYFNKLITGGHMQNAADMGAFEMRDFCRDIGAPLIP